MKVYTKTGDEGMTSLVGGERVSKTHLRLEAYGTVDELNAALGLLVCFCEEEKRADFQDDIELLEQIQCQLFVVGSHLATNTDNNALRPNSIVEESDVQALEQATDAAQELLSKQFCFVIPGGCKAAAQAHVCRTVCRRAEREILRLHEAHPIDSLVRQYINRLSDYLFILSRKMNVLTQTEEKKWRKKAE
ncbi:MAG: cob(I)yrinic acid a,c-diamide adenosyltransferase [Bacteroidaceae bacterium]|nr:cob(I)yrinic acid a,c-diamide adenosyltransferase [Bacteroidaceae bacterium]